MAAPAVFSSFFLAPAPAREAAWRCFLSWMCGCVWVFGGGVPNPNPNPNRVGWGWGKSRRHCSSFVCALLCFPPPGCGLCPGRTEGRESALLPHGTPRWVGGWGGWVGWMGGVGWREGAGVRLFFWG